jgi:methylase of polypeptide subunit release factors
LWSERSLGFRSAARSSSATTRLIGSDLRYVEHLESVYHFFHWQLEFPEIFLTPEKPPGFDVVLTNPPYVNANELNDALSSYEKPYWRTRYESARGAYDLYVLFIELCLRITREGAYTTLITPNKYLAAPYATALRDYLGQHHRILQVLASNGQKAMRIYMRSTPQNASSRGESGRLRFDRRAAGRARHVNAICWNVVDAPLPGV